MNRAWKSYLLFLDDRYIWEFSVLSKPHHLHYFRFKTHTKGAKQLYHQAEKVSLLFSVYTTPPPFNLFSLFCLGAAALRSITYVRHRTNSLANENFWLFIDFRSLWHLVSLMPKIVLPPLISLAGKKCGIEWAIGVAEQSTDWQSSHRKHPGNANAHLSVRILFAQSNPFYLGLLITATITFYDLVAIYLITRVHVNMCHDMTFSSKQKLRCWNRFYSNFSFSIR